MKSLFKPKQDGDVKTEDGSSVTNSNMQNQKSETLSIAAERIKYKSLLKKKAKNEDDRGEKPIRTEVIDIGFEN